MTIDVTKGKFAQWRAARFEGEQDAGAAQDVGAGGGGEQLAPAAAEAGPSAPVVARAAEGGENTGGSRGARGKRPRGEGEQGSLGGWLGRGSGARGS